LKALILLLAGLIAGYFLYPAFHTQPKAIKLSEENVGKFQEFVNKEAKDFAMLETAEDKLKAAEAMYGKMMVLFLAHLGLKSNYDFKPAATMAKIETVQEKKIPEEPRVAEKEEPLSNPGRRDLYADEVKSKPKAENKTDQERYEQYRMSQYIEKFDEKAKRLLGSFRGTLKHDSPKNEGRVDSVLMEFNLHQEDGKVTGDTLVVMADPSNVEYSRNAGNGGNRAMKSISQDADSYYVDASPTSYFLINLKTFPEVTGQYYERGKLIGTVNLRKTDGF
jgi:hypothetical protein